MKTVNVLFVDDDPGITRYMKRKFRRTDFTVYEANNGVDALNIMNEIEFQVIVTDQCMPEMEGFDFLKEAHVKQPNAFKLMLSGRQEAQDVSSQYPVHKFILKPCFDDELESMIDEAAKMSIERRANYG